MIKNRQKKDLERPKKIKSISFSGVKGYKALEILNESNHNFGDSGLIIDLLLLFDLIKKRESNIILTDDELIEQINNKFIKY